MAGNTTLFHLIEEEGLEDVATFIDTSRLGLSYITEDSDHALHLGATTTFREIAYSPALDNKSYYAVKEVSMEITPPQIRNTATVGGALCSGIAFYDFPVVVHALDSSIKVSSADADRVIKASDFFVDYFVTALLPEEMLVEVKVPSEPRTGSAFVRIGRESADFSMVNACASVTLDSSMERFEDARISIGAIANTPVRHTSAESILKGGDATEETILTAAGAKLDCEPIPSPHASARYKAKVVRPVVAEVLRKAYDRARRSL